MGNQASNFVANDRVLKAAAFNSVPNTKHIKNGDLHRLNAESSNHFGVSTGGVSGRHEYTFTTRRNTVDIVNGSIMSPNIVAIAKADISEESGYKVVSKSVEGSSWNSAFKSDGSVDPLDTDFAVSWAVEDIGKSVREMGGLDNAPGNSASYRTIDWAVYQVGNLFYKRVYEVGSSILIPDYTNEYLSEGDRLGIKVVNGVVTYFLVRQGVVKDIYTSTSLAKEPLFFKGALYRGTDLTSHSVMGDVKFHVGQKDVIVKAKIGGNSGDLLSKEDLELLRYKVGMVCEEDSTYSDIFFRRLHNTRFVDPSTGKPYDVDMTHAYHAVYGQNTQTLTET